MHGEIGNSKLECLLQFPKSPWMLLFSIFWISRKIWCTEKQCFSRQLKTRVSTAIPKVTMDASFLYFLDFLIFRVFAASEFMVFVNYSLSRFLTFWILDYSDISDVLFSVWSNLRKLFFVSWSWFRPCHATWSPEGKCWQEDWTKRRVLEVKNTI